MFHYHSSLPQLPAVQTLLLASPWGGGGEGGREEREGGRRGGREEREGGREEGEEIEKR